ncbi:MAG TPA: hypothetical protein ENN64_00520, partial [bacterium]|nr:hypothetical protein [bacterium]
MFFMGAKNLLHKLLKGEYKRYLIYVLCGSMLTIVVVRKTLSKADTTESKGSSLTFQEERSAEKQEDLSGEDEEACEIVVDVAGAVNKPGVYCLEDGAVINDAIESAGGIRKDKVAKRFVEQWLNRALQVKDHQKIYIPFQDDVICKREEAPTDPSGVNKVSNSLDVKGGSDIGLDEAICVSINNASLEELMSLSGVGEVTGNKIIENRPYS